MRWSVLCCRVEELGLAQQAEAAIVRFARDDTVAVKVAAAAAAGGMVAGQLADGCDLLYAQHAACHHSERGLRNVTRLNTAAVSTIGCICLQVCIFSIARPGSSAGRAAGPGPAVRSAARRTAGAAQHHIGYEVPPSA
jgi:hypothetical protein